MPARNAALLGRNALKLGLFGANCSNGRTYAKIPDAWVASWENNLRLAQSELRAMLDHDQLTGVLNRRSLPALLCEGQITGAAFVVEQVVAGAKTVAFA